jgi:hypothetical protein
MTKLSPAAQAVKDAVLALYPDKATQDIGWPLDIPAIAAAIRAAADQVLPDFDEPDWGACDQMRCDIDLYTDHQRKRQQLLAIAAELEAL